MSFSIFQSVELKLTRAVNKNERLLKRIEELEFERGNMLDRTLELEGYKTTALRLEARIEKAIGTRPDGLGNWAATVWIDPSGPNIAANTMNERGAAAHYAEELERVLRIRDARITALERESDG